MIAHDPSLVILSITIAILGTFTASVMTSNVEALSRGEGRMRIFMAALTLGGCIWAMNFVGLLAIDAPVNLTRDPVLLGTSAAVSFIGTAVALFLLWPKGMSAARLPPAIVLLGIAICATSYLGIAAVAGRGLELSWFLAAICAVFATQSGLMLLVFLFQPRGVILTLMGAIALGLLLTAAHYLAIASAPGLEDALLAIPRSHTGISERYLAWAATIMMYFLCSICLSVFVITQFREDIR
jgi:NO-binding membrane sensor protein with MHYT domain